MANNINPRPNPRSTVIGIDQSLTATGYVVLSTTPIVASAAAGSGIGFNPLLIAHGTITPSTRGVERLCEEEIAVRALLDTHNPALVLLEDYAFSRGNQAHQMGELGGVLRRLLHRRGQRWMVVGTGQCKQYATGKGNAPKELMLQQVLKRWGVELGTSHEADAYTLARIGVALLAGERIEAAGGSAAGVDGLTKVQVGVLEKIRGGKAAKADKAAGAAKRSGTSSSAKGKKSVNAV